MAKSGRKRKKADKAKVQLKAKKDLKLPKGLNVTNAEVKTKTIVVQNQIKGQQQDQGPKVTRKRLGLQEILTKIVNMSVSTRADGLEGLLELVQHHPDIVETHSSLVLAKLLPFLTEKEGKLRNQAIKILDLIFRTSGSSLKPLYDIICVHVCCALSHIELGIQRGALRLLDTVIDSMPELIRVHHGQILPNCLSQISVKSGKLDTGVSDAISSTQRRTDVINRIAKLLKILVVEEDNSHEDKPVRKLNFGKDFLHVGLYQHAEDLVLANSKSQKGFQLADFLEGVIPVLLDVWSECMPQSKPGKKATLQADCLELMCFVTETLSLVCSIVKGNFKTQIMDCVVSRFPVHFGAKNQGEVVDLNINICSLYLALEQPSETTSKLVIDYVSNLLDSNKADVKRHLPVVSKVAEMLDTNNDLVVGLMPLNSGLVCNVLRRHEVPRKDELVKHLISTVLTPKRVTSDHLKVVEILGKRQDRGLIESIKKSATTESLNAVTDQEVLKTLTTVAHRDPCLSRLLLNRVKTFSNFDDYTQSFCLNVLS